MVRVPWLLCRKSPEGFEFEYLLCHMITINFLCLSSGKWETFLELGKDEEVKVWDGLHLSYAVPKISGVCNLYCPYSY